MNSKTKNILKNIGIAIIVCILFGSLVIVASAPITDAKEICVLNHNGDTLYFNNSENIKYNKYSDNYIYIQDSYGNKYKFINTVVKVTTK